MSADVDTPAGDDAGNQRPQVALEVVNGKVRIVAAPDAVGSAELSWPVGAVCVMLLGERVEGNSCRVPANAQLSAEALDEGARVDYAVTVSRDRMEASLRVIPETGLHRTITDRPATQRLHLTVIEERIEPPAADAGEALSALQRAGVVHGCDSDAVIDAVRDQMGDEIVVAHGTEPIEGRGGYLEHLVDFEALRWTGVLADTPLVRRVRKRDGTPGRDVTGRELTVPVVRDVRIQAGPGVAVDERGIMAIATVDGSPRGGTDGYVEVCHELELEEVDTVTGDINFNGSVYVTGSVHEGRRLIARDEIIIDGNVERAHVESGGSMRVAGSIMSSVLRAGGERAVAATIADRVFDLPKALGLVAAQARQFRDQGESRGTDVSHGLSVQLVLERIHRGVLPSLWSIVEDVRDAGPAHAETAERAARWHRLLATAANISLTPDRFQEILAEVSALSEDVRRAIEQPADLVVTYMQASEAEATGAVTLVGKGIFNSRIVAWGGLVSQHYEAVFRGGSILSHGKVHVREVGSPAGASTVVQLGKGAALEADRAFAGTVVSGPGYTHRFVADRSCIKVDFDTGGTMNVESLAA